MGMPVMKEAGAQWLTGLYDKLRREKGIIINGYKKVGIVDIVRSIREAPFPREENPMSNENIEDPFDSCSELEESNPNTIVL